MNYTGDKLDTEKLFANAFKRKARFDHDIYNPRTLRLLTEY